MSRHESWFCRTAPWRSFAARVLPWATSGVTLSGDVLEIGAGSGAMAEAAARHWPSASITATDLDPAMVRVAASRVPSARVADATALPFEDGSFDGVLSFLMLHHTLAWEAVVAEAMRVLRPGGTFVGYDALDTPLARAVHVVERSPYRLVTADALRGALAPFASASVTPAVGGQLVRFVATRA
jgi:ubiquinone/menaquinone biosynthesis C-methylase UbiE